MRISYAPDMAPLAAMAGGPNEESDGFADGLVATSPLETHKVDLSLPEGYVSRADKWRRLTQSKVARVAAFLALAVPLTGALTACAENERPSGVGTSAVPNAAGQGGGEVVSNPNCYTQFDKLDIAAQEECRALIGGMELGDVNKLTGLDHARWASYYRHSVLGEKGILHNLVRSAIIDHDGAPDVAQTFLVDYQVSIYEMAWLMQKKAEIAQDPRTGIVLLGTDDKNSDSYKLAKAISEYRPAGSTPMSTYARAASNPQLFSSYTPDTPVAHHNSDGIYTLSFSADLITADSGSKTKQFTFTLYPHLDISHDDTGKGKEAKDDPNDPIRGALGTPLLADTPIINSNAA
jgi:hypothetical protein